MAQLIHQHPIIDPGSIYADARDAADTIDQLADWTRRLYRDNRTATPEHRAALNSLTELSVIVDGLARDAAEILDTDE